VTRVAVIAAGPSGLGQVRAFQSASKREAKIPEVRLDMTRWFMPLMQRGSTWYYRRTIPLHLRPLMEGRREIWLQGPPCLRGRASHTTCKAG
jgi:hypothetical protein